MSGPSRFYRGAYRIANPVFRVFYRIKIVGRENINQGAAVICVSHSSMLDPIFLGMALSIKHQPHIIAKAEIYKNPFLAWLVGKLGAIKVDRNKPDINTIKESLGYLRNGAKVAIFPEGTRVADDASGAAKHGAVKIAERAGAPILPVYLPRKKRVFGRVRIVIGKSYEIPKQAGKRTHEDYDKLSDELMDRILELKEQ